MMALGLLILRCSLIISSAPTEPDLFAPVQQEEQNTSIKPLDVLTTTNDDNISSWSNNVSKDTDLHFTGGIESSLHYRIEDRSVGEFYNRQEQTPGVSRFENSLKLKLEAALDNIVGVVDVDLDWLSYPHRYHNLADLSKREEIDPMRLEAHALYLEVVDFFGLGLDLRVGQQLILWGVGDQFNPTNNLNSNNLENVLLFGEQVANFMVRLDYSLFDTWILSAVLVPVFKPAILPVSARVGLTAVDRIPFADEHLRLRLHNDRELGAEFGAPTVVKEIIIRQPRSILANMPFAFRIAGDILGHDVALSYYFGRHDIPQPVANHVTQDQTKHCDPNNEKICVDSILQTKVTMAYPKVQVLGINFAGELAFEIGYRLELGLYFPKEMRTKLTQDEINIMAYDLFPVKKSAGEYDYQTKDKKPPIVIPTKPFAKWILGFDYTITQNFYLNLMWVHGMPDEFGAGDFFNDGWDIRQAGAVKDSSALDCTLEQNGEKCAWEIVRPRLGDYLVVGIDFRFLEQKGLLRLFSIWELSGYNKRTWSANQMRRVSYSYSFHSKQGYSAIIYPKISYNYGNGFEIELGALVQLGNVYTKFGDPAAGGSIIWTSLRFRF